MNKRSDRARGGLEVNTCGDPGQWATFKLKKKGFTLSGKI